MKKTLYFLIVFFGLLITNAILNALVRKKFKNDYALIDNSLVKKEEIKEIEHLTDSIVYSIQNGIYYEFQGRFNEIGLIKKLDISAQKSAGELEKSKYGNYENIEFHSILKSKSENTHMYKIYRFKALFDSNKDVEVRSYLNIKNEIIWVNILPWKKKLYN